MTDASSPLPGQDRGCQKSLPRDPRFFDAPNAQSSEGGPRLPLEQAVVGRVWARASSPYLSLPPFFSGCPSLMGGWGEKPE